eukprot:Gb_05611 [translate_table: standard]
MRIELVTSKVYQLDQTLLVRTQNPSSNVKNNEAKQMHIYLRNSSNSLPDSYFPSPALSNSHDQLRQEGLEPKCKHSNSEISQRERSPLTHG